MQLRCLIVDDEPIARQGLQRYCRNIPFIELVKTCDSALDARDTLQANSIDLVFLDIQMPGLTGIQFLQSMATPPMTIITTAYPNFALDGFELDVIDYLVKPFAFERFLKACSKAKEYFELKDNNPANTQENYFFIKSGNTIEKIEYNEILFVQARENYCCIHTEKQKHLTLVPLKTIEAAMRSDLFIKVQKSYLVAKSRIDKVEGNTLVVGAYRIPISRKWKHHILNSILSDKLLRR